MARLFDRRVAISVGEFRFVSDQAGNAMPLRLEDGTPLRGFKVAFRVDRSHESKANKAQAQVFNLNEDTRGKLQINERKAPFIIEAGYIDTFAQIFSGDAVEISSTRNMPGIVTTLKAQDGYKASKERIVKSFSPGVDVGDVISDIADSLKVNAKKAIAKAKAGDFTGGVKQLFNGLSISGNSKVELDKLAKTYGFDWSIQDGELQMLLPTETTGDDAVVLGPGTGLIGSPVRVKDDKRPKTVIVRGRSLLQPKIRPGRRIELESVEISGTFRTLKLTHAGQSDAGEFYTDFEGVEL